MKQLFLLVLFSGWISGLVQAQYFQTGEDPASINWRQINTGNFQLIYPDYYETQANELAAVLEEVYRFGGNTLHHNPKKISVLLHTQTVQSNGLVAWAPKRIEFYTTPHQSIYPQDWLEQLALHEFRHLVQIDKINENLPELIKLILGQQGTALVFGVHLPWWFIEGDAVVTETALSKFGRGRYPSFLMEHQAQVVEKGIFSYDKAYFGSYRDFVPNHYKLGYYLVGGSRVMFGSELWDSVLMVVGKNPISIAPLNKALKVKTGFGKASLYQFVFDSLQQVWLEEDKIYHSPPFKVISPDVNIYTNYQYNHWVNDSTLFSYKTSFDQIPAFVKINKSSGLEKLLYHPGIIFNESVNYRDNLIVWSEQIPDPRWAHSGKSLIRIWNSETYEITEIKPEFKSFSPSISPDKTKVAVVEADFSNHYFISIYNIKNGILLNHFQTQNDNYFFAPEWINDNEMAVVVLTENGKKIDKLNLNTGEFEQLLNESYGDLKQLKSVKNNLYFISSYTGKNALFRMNLEDNKVVQVYEPRFGVESPAISSSKNEIVLSDYTADGFRLIAIPGGYENEVPIDIIEKGSYPLAHKLSEQEPGQPDLTGLKKVEYQSKNYSKAAHLFNFHSWAPAFIDAASYEILPGVSLMSQNLLGTSETIVGYKWDYTEKAGQLYAAYKYKGWFPVLNFEISSGNRASEYRLINQTKNEWGQVIKQDTTSERFLWGETNAGIDLNIPLKLSKGQYNRFLQPEISYDFTLYKHRESTPHGFYEGNFQSLSYRLYFYQLLRQSQRDVYPDFGVIFDVAYRNSPFGTTSFGNLTTIQTNLFLPGLLDNHGIKVYGGIQNKKMNKSYGFSDAIRYPRGWGSINTTRMYSLGVDYKLPLIYPDWNMRGLWYLKRVNFDLFADFARLKGNTYKNNLQVGTFTSDISSLGFELTGDINFLRFYAPVNIGIRTSYLPKIKDFYFDFLFSLNLASF